jgi:hypothetical protein
VTDEIASPEDLPFGAVLVQPGTGRWAVRFQVDDTSGRGMHCWLVPPSPAVPVARVLHHVEVRGWTLVKHPAIAGEETAQLQAELADLRASREAWAIEADRLDAELAERPTVWAYEQATQALEKRRVALVTALGGDREGQGFYDAIDDVEQLASRPAIPDDWEEQIRAAICDSAEARPGANYDRIVERAQAPVRSWLAPVSRSDITADGGENGDKAASARSWHDTAGIAWSEVKPGFVTPLGADGQPLLFGQPVSLEKVRERYGPLTEIAAPASVEDELPEYPVPTPGTPRICWNQGER